MDGVHNLFGTILFIIQFWITIIVLILLFIVQLPFQLITHALRARSGMRVRRHRAKVHVTTVESQRDNEATRDTIMLIHGFPDGPPLWSPTVRRLTAAGYRCLVVSLPGCRGQPVDKPISVATIIEQLHSALVNVHSVTVVGHGWGVFYAMLLRKWYPRRVHRMVLLDSGEMNNVHWTVKIAMFSYQLCLILCYYIGHPIGTYALRLSCYTAFNYRARPLEELQSDMAWPYPALAISMMHKYGLSLNLKRGKTDGGTTKETVLLAKNKTATNNNCININNINVNMNYSSRTKNRNVMTFLTNRDENSSRHGKGKENRIRKAPTLYLYGKQKPFHFHDERFLHKVRRTPHGAAEALDAGHWVQRDVEKVYLSTIVKWLDTTRSVVPKSHHHHH